MIWPIPQIWDSQMLQQGAEKLSLRFPNDDKRDIAITIWKLSDKRFFQEEHLNPSCIFKNLGKRDVSEKVRVTIIQPFDHHPWSRPSPGAEEHFHRWDSQIRRKGRMLQSFSFFYSTGSAVVHSHPHLFIRNPDPDPDSWFLIQDTWLVCIESFTSFPPCCH